MPFAVDKLKPGVVALIGLCSDANSSFRQGPAQAPPAIRAVLHSGATNLTTEAGIDLAGHPDIVDLGDFEIPAGDGGTVEIERLIGADIVEYNPRRDIEAMTAMMAAKRLKEIGGRMLSKS